MIISLSWSSKNLNHLHSATKRGEFWLALGISRFDLHFGELVFFGISITSSQVSFINGWEGASFRKRISMACLEAGFVCSTCIMWWMYLLFGSFSPTDFLLISPSTLKGPILQTIVLWHGWTDEDKFVSNIWLRYTWSPGVYESGLYRSPFFADPRASANYWAKFTFWKYSSNRFLHSPTV